MRNYIIPVFASIAVLASSCNKDEIIPIPDDQKTPIEFSVSGDGSSMMTKAGFTGATRVIARFQSDELGSSNVKYAKAILTAAADGTNDATSFSLVSYATDSEKKYWDDAFGRKGQISVYAVAIPNEPSAVNLTDSKVAGASTWGSEASNSIVWSVSTDQSSNPLASEDLVYSNNIQDGGLNGRYTYDYAAGKYPDNTGATTHADGRLVFTQAEGAQTSDAGHFDKGHLVFNHSLSRLTVTLEEGVGFDGNKTTAADFNFTNSGANIQLDQMITTGTLDIKAGTWGATSPANITKMAPTGTHYGANGSYTSQMLPGYKFYEDGTANVMQFVIDNNTYYVTQAQVFKALNVSANTTGTTPLVTVGSDASGNYIEMQQGKNYTLSITVKKTGIESLTATLAEWVNVTGSTSINNAHLEFTMSASGAACDKDIDLYRLGDENTSYDANNYDFSYEGKNWYGEYLTTAAAKTTLLHSALSSGKWSTPWFFESNKTYYHFRTVNSGTTVLGNDDDEVNDYFEIAGGAVASTDPHWGAPMTGSGTAGYLKYDVAKGYEAFLRPAIGATESTIAIQEIHMMSNINVILKTTDDGGKIALKDGDTETVVKITRLAATGKVEMGRGLVTPDATYTGEHTMTNPTTFWAEGNTNQTMTQAYTYAVVPQTLTRVANSTNDNDYVGIFIQTPDQNQYYVVKKLSEITADTVSDTRDQAQGAKIQRWFPGHNYTYTITITKAGIQAITATVADWVEVSGSIGNIDLES
ncbi:MAG: fimbrillin family protein [Bacteroidales bacterium]|nr:fimbrillin family protein [Bacteroidales bacterium]